VGELLGSSSVTKRSEPSKPSKRSRSEGALLALKPSAMELPLLRRAPAPILMRVLPSRGGRSMMNYLHRQRRTLRASVSIATRRAGSLLEIMLGSDGSNRF